MNNETSGRGLNKAFILIGILLALLAIGAIGFYTNSSNTPAAQGGFAPAPAPEGEAPPGKVWSYEHGHWHDAF